MTRARAFAEARLPHFAIVLSFLPVLLFAYLGWHSRPMSDDYCHLRYGLDLGPWQGALHWRQTWNGSYADYFLHGLVAPLGAAAPALAPAAIMSLWLAGLAWVVHRVLALLGVDRHRLPIALGLAALIVAVSVNALFSLESIYWYAASARYALPLALLAIYGGLTLEYGCRPRSRRMTGAAICASFALCFFAGGLSEIHLALQIVVITLALPAVYALVPKSARAPFLLLLASGWAATLASLAVQLTAPGVSIRASRIAETTALPNRDLVYMLSRSVEEVFFYLADSRSFAAFIMLLAASLTLTVAFYEPAARLRIHKPIQFARLPLLGALAFQLICVPMLWSHTSDNPQILGRFSAGFAIVLLLNAALVMSLVALAGGQARVNRRLREGVSSFGVLPGVAMLVIVSLFAMTQLRGVHWRASTYLFLSCNLILALLLWLIAPSLPRAVRRRLGLLVAIYFVIAFAANVAILIPQLHTYGFLQRRIPAFAPHSIALFGLIWGGVLGFALQRFRGAAVRSDLGRRWLRGTCLITAFVIGAGIVFGHLPLVSPFQQYAGEWQARHDHIIKERDRGSRTIRVESLTFDLDEFMQRRTIDGQTCPPIYYGVDRIVAVES